MSGVVFLIFSLSSFMCLAQEISLDDYIKKMNFKSLDAPPQKREALYQLGLRLFYDKQLSGKENISCHCCHSLTGFSGDTLPLAVGEGADGLAVKRIQNQGAIIARNSPPLYNLGTKGVSSLFWDGRVTTHPKGGWMTPEEGLNGPSPALSEIARTLDSLLSVQALFPMTSPEEMLGQGSNLSRIETWESVMKRLFTGRLGASYKRFFKEAYPDVETFNIGHAANAIAELERHHFVANNTLWDQYLRGKKEVLSARMKRGAILFMSKASCTNCHTGDHLTSFGFQNAGIPQIGPGVNGANDKGRAEWTKNKGDAYRFRVSPLRNIALTAPYMHSGVFSTLWEVIDHYNYPMRSLHHFQWDTKHPRYREDLLLDQRNETTVERTKTLASNLPRNLELTADERSDLFCFLVVALTDQKNQADLISKGILTEITDCSPRL